MTVTRLTKWASSCSVLFFSLRLRFSLVVLAIRLALSFSFWHTHTHYLPRNWQDVLNYPVTFNLRVFPLKTVQLTGIFLSNWHLCSRRRWKLFPENKENVYWSFFTIHYSHIRKYSSVTHMKHNTRATRICTEISRTERIQPITVSHEASVLSHYAVCAHGTADRHEKLYGRSGLYASAQGRHETGGVLSLFSSLSFDISIKNSVQR